MSQAGVLRPLVVVSAMAVTLLSGCATVPTGPSVMVLPGTGKTFEQFQTDDAVCRQFASQSVGTSPGHAATESTLQGRYDIAYRQCMYAKGHQVPW